MLECNLPLLFLFVGALKPEAALSIAGLRASMIESASPPTLRLSPITGRFLFLLAASITRKI